MNLSVKDAAQLLHVSEKTIYRWIKKAMIPAYRFEGQHRFNRAELLEWATSRRMAISAEVYHDPEAAGQPLPTLTESLDAGGIIYRLEGQTRDAVLANLVAQLRLPEEVDRDYLLQVLIARENLASTSIGDGIAIPRPHNPVLLQTPKPAVTLAFLEQPVDFHSLDGQPVRILFTLIGPTLRAHLYLLSMLGFALRHPRFMHALQEQAGREEIFTALQQVKEGFGLGEQAAARKAGGAHR